ncbi:MAG: cadmium-translocating P-type ATPase [Clostridia bacterium]|nr:cadmium-translocating P-type ATPase [Clostridia bacterium]
MSHHEHEEHETEERRANVAQADEAQTAGEHHHDDDDDACCCGHDHEHHHDDEDDDDACCCRHDHEHHHDDDDDGCGCGHHHGHDHHHDDGCGCGHEHGGSEEGERKKMIVRLSVAGALLVIGLLLRHFASAAWYVQLPIFLTAYIVIGYDVVIGAVKGLFKGHVFGESFLMTIASVGAFCIGEFPEAVAVMLFYQLGEMLEDIAVDRSRDSITDLMDIRPDTATVWQDGAWVTGKPNKVKVGSRILVKPGERIPLDGVVVEGKSALDTRALTGESVPRSVQEGDAVLSGCINESGALTIETIKSFSESTASKILDLVENAASRKAPSERFISRFAKYYTPIVVGLAALVFLLGGMISGNWVEWLRKSFVFLVISCPCALVISIPLTFFGGLGAASKHGILIKGSNYLEALTDIGAVVFDKTGTLTKGEFAVQKVLPHNVPEQELLGVAASAEQLSNHPIAKSILAKCDAPELPACDVYEEISGHGIRAEFGDDTVLCGNEKLLLLSGIPFEPVEADGTKVYVTRNDEYLGCIVIADAVKADSAETVAALKERGIKTVMLTGDGRATAEAVAKTVGVNEFHAELLPQDKVEKIETLAASGKTVFVGDGINDAPVLARADIGVAMGALGSDAAIEAADVVLMTDEPKKLVEALDLAKATRKIVLQNILFALGIKVLFMLLGVLGIAGMWIAVIGDVGVMLLAVLNAMRILKK